jgi:hypothetical protein
VRGCKIVIYAFHLRFPSGTSRTLLSPSSASHLPPLDRPWVEPFAEDARTMTACGREITGLGLQKD